MKTKIIIFSKNRTLQLKSLLLSLRAFGDIDERQIFILYRLTAPEIEYEPLMTQFACRFVEENVFLEDLRKEVADDPNEYVLFMVDDLVFRDTFRLSDVETLLDRRNDIDGFCFRLGDNIDNQPRPEFESVDDRFLVWDTASGLGKYWNYFWELSSSLYRMETVREYLAVCRTRKESFPNPLEYHYYSCMPTTRASWAARIRTRIRYPFRKCSQRLACYRKSKCLTQGVNLVASIGGDRTEHFNPVELHQRMMDGYIADFRSLTDLDLRSPQPGHHHFCLIKEEECQR